ncbi:MAG: prepilin peptidase [Geminicoccaceae bacterium]
MLLYGMFLILLMLAAAGDVARFRIPNALSGTLLVLFPLAAVGHIGAIDWVGHLGAGGIALAGGFLLFLLNGVGAGDVKLFAATSMWLGFGLLPAHLVATSLLGLALVGVLLVLRALTGGLATATDRVIGPWSPPEVLRRGANVPYGVAIAASAALLASSAPPALWLF